MMRAIYTLGILMLCLSDVMAQPLHTRTYTPDDGLHTLETYAIWELNEEVYIVSIEGIQKWDGYRWEFLSSDSTHTSYKSTAAWQLNKGWLIGNTYVEPTTYVNNGSWTPIDKPKNTIGHVVSYESIDNGLLSSNGNIWAFNEDLLVYEKVDSLLFAFQDHNLIGAKINNHWLVRHFKIGRTQKYDIVNLKTKNNTKEPSQISYIFIDGVKIEVKLGASIFKVGEQLVDITNLGIPFKKVKQLTIEGEQDYLAMFFGEDNQVNYVRIENNLASLLGQTEVEIHLNNNRPFRSSNSRSLWLTSHSGLHRTDYHRLYFSERMEGMVPSIHTLFEKDEKVFFGSYLSGSAYFDGEAIYNFNAGKLRFLTGAYTHEGVTYSFIESPNTIAKFSNDRWDLLTQYRDGKESAHSGYMINKLKDGRLGVGLNTDGFGIVDSLVGDNVYITTVSKDKGMTIPNILDFTQDTSARIWMGGRGVALYEMDRDTAWTFSRIANDDRTFGAMTLVSDHDDRVWIGTNKGLYCLDNASTFDPMQDDFYDRVRRINLPNGETRLMAALHITRDSTLVIGGQQSVSFLDLKNYQSTDPNPYIYQLYYGDDLSGQGTEQNCLLQDSKGYVWVGAQDGALRLDLKHEGWDTLPNKIEIISCSTGKGDITLENDTYTIPTDSRNLVLEYGPDHNPSLRKSTFYDRYLINSSGDTLQALEYDQEGHLELNYLAPDDYELHIIAKKHNQIIDQRNIKINVPMALTENPLFWGGLVFALMGVLLAFVNMRNKEQKRRLKNEKTILQKNLQLSVLEKEKDQQQIQAIISSFNPHFINNSLHWAQSRYNKDEPFVRVIGRLSENIRYLFEKTREGKAYHSIMEEIEVVQNYLAIQQERFGEEGYAFELPDTDILAQLGARNVFLMQIQIFVENAIEHGIRHRDTGGYVKVDLKSEEEHFIISILDNGIGRAAAAQISTSGTQQGTKMIRSLIDIYNVHNTEKITLSYEDLPLTESGQKCGTLVNIIIPHTYNYSIG